MAEAEVHQLAPCISCHAWNGDLSMVALCPNNSEVHIYRASPFGSAEWERLHVLDKHDQLVSSIGWGSKSNLIVTCSHDRNSYVWHMEEGQWQATLVILRLNRAALCVDWSPKENKFAVGSGAKSVCVCYYEPENNWWVSKLIKKRHASSVTSVAWHPNNVLIATTSTDGKCRIFAAAVKGVDLKADMATSFGDNKFGEQLLQLDLTPAWTFGARWSPSGNTLAYVGHDSTIHFVNDVGPDLFPHSLRLRHLPLRDIAFLSETQVVAVGYDAVPLLFAVDKEGNWTLVRQLDDAKSAIPSPRRSSQFSDAFDKFDAQTRRGESAESVEPMRVPSTRHHNCITCILPLADTAGKATGLFSTSGLDGRIVVWNAGNLLAAESMATLSL